MESIRDFTVGLFLTLYSKCSPLHAFTLGLLSQLAQLLPLLVPRLLLQLLEEFLAAHVPSDSAVALQLGSNVPCLLPAASYRELAPSAVLQASSSTLSLLSTHQTSAPLLQSFFEQRLLPLYRIAPPSSLGHFWTTLRIGSQDSCVNIWCRRGHLEQCWSLLGSGQCHGQQVRAWWAGLQQLPHPSAPALHSPPSSWRPEKPHDKAQQYGSLGALRDPHKKAQQNNSLGALRKVYKEAQHHDCQARGASLRLLVVQKSRLQCCRPAKLG